MKVVDLYNALYNNVISQGLGNLEVYADIRILEESVDLYAGIDEDNDPIATVDRLP